LQALKNILDQRELEEGVPRWDKNKRAKGQSG
jgi:hypothetical protein